MDSTLILLKEEINKTNEAEHDLAKWKLGVTAALGAAALGVGKDGSPPYWLLLSIPLFAPMSTYSYTNTNSAFRLSHGFFVIMAKEMRLCNGTSRSAT
jgi:hypothetical protein